ncbi:type VI secretion system protein ImpG [Burkholderia ubonensis]|uniref:type VI secretion system baseplate subunit TssF n=1 Tax=Burkholderia ubonensis TaxID=101571 RepID=UPI000755F008|nr:type VI secretion system baseplate subunit TssF [Burkholderia ubonensis]KVM03718.1 type VI secretion system protein ImpG [Burkholderia ubonensis]KVM17841.1 type VI secretion system protein ImpG [Burkholderia ubonensis]KVM52250.1 type VI secretion system protein ImpG [Burkholderia ubonensis]KVX60655.1 type VI secretion system protein ImpG [Burkholderia ubonensis]KVZ00964.1 type VI secretion system protein ImpG [Burkholderia ubonensis]
METHLLEYYNRELAYLRELGAEFAQQFPKVAARLRLPESGPPDPYVERLLEGFSFLTARVQLKMDAEFPRFTHALLDAVYPGYVAPLPSMAIVQFAPVMNEGSLAQGWRLPAGTALRARPASPEQPTACEFRTAHDLTLWPLELTDAAVTGAPAYLPRGIVPARRDVRGALRIRLRARGGARLAQLPLDRLMLHLAGPERDALHLLELIAAHTLGVVVHDPGQPQRWAHALGAHALVHQGFDAEQAILPDDGRSFHGYRLLREYFAFPARFLFFSIDGLRPALARATGDECELTLLFDRHDAALEAAVDARHLALNCTPAVNLFRRRGDRIPVAPGVREHHVVVDRSRPLDYEVYAVERLASEPRDDGRMRGQPREFRPFHASFAGDDGNFGAYYTVRREPRLVSAQARANGTRTGYVGSEVYVSLVDSQCAPYDESMRYLAVDTLCTNRDLVLLQPPGDANTFTLRVSAPVERIVAIRGPSRPRPPIADAQTAWRLIRHLGLARHTLTDLDDEEGAHVLRELLGLHADPADAAMRRQIDGVRRVAFAPVFHRLPAAGPLMFGRGVQVDVTVDDHAFSGDSPFLLGAVLEQFFARHVSINAFAECVLTSAQRGRLAHWPARVGRRPAI